MTYYKEFEQYNDPDMTKISILHSLGSKFVDGFYSMVCKQYGIERKTIKDVYNIRDKFSAVCNDLLEQVTSKAIGMYDYVFIDEAQDFPIGFFKLALRTLRPTGKLLYAYDELQTLNSDVKIPTKYSIFGKRQCEDIYLSICYRTPKEILVTANAIGLGVYRKKEDGSSGIVNMIQDISTWSAIGYEVSEGELSYGKDVALSRNDVIATKCSNCVVVDEKSTEIDQYEFVANEILNMLENEDVKSDDILIIDLDSININDNFARFKDVFTSLMWDNTTKKWKSAVNLVNKDNAIKFRISNSIPYTTIFRAKGNEANIVFVINSHKMQSISSYSRNRIFTAMTRARFKVYLLGVGNMQTFIEESKAVQANDYKLCFKYPTKNELKQIENIAQTELQNAKDYKTIVDLLKNFKSNPAIIKEILLEQTGCSSIEEFFQSLYDGEPGSDE